VTINLRKPHPHAEFIKAWADGAVIQHRSCDGSWQDTAYNKPLWEPSIEYRVRPAEPREFYVNVYGRCVEEDNHVHRSRADADACAHSTRLECIKVREVIE
jgi:hypothetical protein